MAANTTALARIIAAMSGPFGSLWEGRANTSGTLTFIQKRPTTKSSDMQMSILQAARKAGFRDPKVIRTVQIPANTRGGMKPWLVELDLGQEVPTGPMPPQVPDERVMQKIGIDLRGLTDVKVDIEDASILFIDKIPDGERPENGLLQVITPKLNALQYITGWRVLRNSVWQGYQQVVVKIKNSRDRTI